eukprot:scaffold221617_cov46-Attheya_sp.AAC.1
MITTTIRIERPEGTLVADKYGSGPAMVLVPGIGDLRSSYRQLAPLLVEAGYTVYNLDLRGHGDSDATFSTYTTEDIANDVLALMDQENISESVFIGNSVGGGAAAWANILAPEKIKSMVLLGPFVRDPSGFKFMKLLLPVLFARPWGAFMWMKFRNTLFVTLPSDHEEVSSKLRATLSDPKRLYALRTMLGASKANITARLGEVNGNALIIMGDKDPDFPDPPSEAQEIAKLLTGADTSVEVVAASGHYVQTEHPEKVSALIVSFLDDNDVDEA